ncbi:MAG: outer rane efflux protein, partial [Bacteroidetes bacterium]|nr:outer rane efflux protein [Bacteroidota bacterium]
MFNKLIIFCFFVCKCAPIQAQDSLPRWSLQTCLDYAKTHNITLNSLRLSRSISEQDLLLSRSAVLPGVSASLAPAVTYSKVTDSNGDLRSRVTTSGTTAASASVTLYNGGYLRNDIKQKQLLVQVAGLDLAASENDITLSITQAYLNILLAKENIVYVRDVVATSEAQVKQEQQFYDAGTVALKDLIQLQAQLANDKYTLVAAENTHRQNMLTLKQILQLPPDTGFAVLEPDTIMSNPVLTTLSEARQTALDNRPEVKSSELSVESAKIGVLKARAGYLPTLSAGAGIGTSYTDNSYYSFMRQMDNNFYQQIGVTLSVPIFSKRANKVNEAVAKLEVGQAELTLQN